MDSFLSLFNPNNDEGFDDNSNYDSTDESVVDPNGNDTLPPEPQVGNIEYKLKLLNPSKQRFEHLVTQMKWRLREGQGEAIYKIGVKDNGVLAGLSDRDMFESLRTLNEMAQKLGATTTVLRQRNLDVSKNVCEVLVRKVPDDQNNIEVRVAVLGTADAGKSTLLGVLTQGNLDNGRGKARLNMFRHLHELQSGRTSSISHEILGFNSQGKVINYSYSDMITSEEICDVSTKLVTFLDLAGHRKYLHTTIQGLSGYLPHHAMLVISSTAGAVGMTHEHLSLAVALNVPFFIVLTKSDLVVGPGDATLDSLRALLKQVGVCKIPLEVRTLDDVLVAGANALAQNVVPIFCVSSVTGDGLDLLTKFLHVLPPGVSSSERARLEQQPPEFQIDERFRAGDVPQVLGGLLTRGVLAEGATVRVGPLKDGTFIATSVRSIQRNRARCRVVRAGQAAAIALEAPLPALRHGMVVLGAGAIATGCLFFQARVVLLQHQGPGCISRGFQATVHLGHVRQTAVLVGIFCSERLHTDNPTSVLFRFKSHPEFVRRGQRLLFRQGLTKGVGEVTQVFPINEDPENDHGTIST